MSKSTQQLFLNCNRREAVQNQTRSKSITNLILKTSTAEAQLIIQSSCSCSSSSVSCAPVWKLSIGNVCLLQGQCVLSILDNSGEIVARLKAQKLFNHYNHCPCARPSTCGYIQAPNCTPNALFLCLTLSLRPMNDRKFSQATSQALVCNMLLPNPKFHHCQNLHNIRTFCLLS